jgi:hypothetical protein
LSSSQRESDYLKVLSENPSEEEAIKAVDALASLWGTEFLNFTKHEYKSANAKAAVAAVLGRVLQENRNKEVVMEVLPLMSPILSQGGYPIIQGGLMNKDNVGNLLNGLDLMGRMRRAIAIDYLIAMSSDKTELVQMNAINALGMTGDRRGLQTILDASVSKNKSVRRASAAALKNFYDKEAINALVSLSKGSILEMSVRYDAILNLGASKSLKAHEYFREFREDKDWKNRLLFLVAVGELRLKEYRSDVVSLTDSPNLIIKKAAKNVLLMLDEVNVTPASRSAKGLSMNQEKGDAVATDAAGITNSDKVRKTQVGGIDLNSSLLNLQIKRDGNGVALPIGEQDWSKIDIQGFIPVIYNIQPVNMTQLLEMAGAPA